MGIVRRIASIEPTGNVVLLLLDADPRTVGVAVGVGSLAYDANGTLYRKTDTGDTDWHVLGWASTSTVVIESAGAPTTDGTNIAAKGSLCIDTTNGNLYINAGSVGTPSWKLVTRAS